MPELNWTRRSLGLLGLVIILCAVAARHELEPVYAGWLLVAGFVGLAGCLAGASRRLVVPSLVAVVMIVFGGFSTVVAVPESLEAAAERAQELTPEQVETSTPAASFDARVNEDGFDYAVALTGLGGLAAVLGSLAAAVAFSPSPRRRDRRPKQIERIGKLLVSIGFLGVLAALIRYGVTQFPIEDLWESFKSFWIGGTILLLVATFAVPGFGLWAAGLSARGASVLEYRALGLLAIVYLALLTPTGQRGFVVALAVVALAILISSHMVSLKQATAIVLAGVLLIGLTQAARNEASGTGRITIDGVAKGIRPSEWRDLYANQIASVNWTALIHQNRERLDIPNSLVALVEKPIPRALAPDKSQGFGDEFTSQVFPAAAAKSVSFAVPLVAELDYNLGFIPAMLIVAIVGALATLADMKLARRAPPAVEAIAVATIFWCFFELTRGDLANAIVFSSGWLVPLVIFSRGLGLRSFPEVKRLVVDALQVAPQFSGIGRRLAEIGEGLISRPPSIPVTVRCPADVKDALVAHFPSGTEFECPIKSSRPRFHRILYQQVVAPLRTGSRTAILSPGDQAPLWGTSRLIFVIHDVRRLARPETSRGGAEAFYYRWIMRIGASRADSLLTISEFSRDQIHRYLNPAVPVSIVTEQPTAISPVDLDPDPDPYVFLVVGALRRYKGLETAVAALAGLKDIDVNVSVWLVGDVEGDRQLLDRITTLADDHLVSGSLELLGWKSDEELDRLYRRSHGTISPSNYEGYGLSVTTSLAYGLPTIASDIPPHRETGGEAVSYFPPGDARRLSEIMRDLAMRPEGRRRSSDAALDRHRELVAASRPWGDAIADAVNDLPR